MTRKTTKPKRERKTPAAYERHLNQLYADTYSWEGVKDRFGDYYKNDKKAEKHLLAHYENHTLGTLLRRCDPKYFEIAFKKWLSEAEN